MSDLIINEKTLCLLNTKHGFFIYTPHLTFLIFFHKDLPHVTVLIYHLLSKKSFFPC